MAQDPQKSPRTMTVKRAFAYAATGLGVQLPVAILSGFSFYFIVYIVGLKPILAAIGNAIATLCNGLMGPFVGYWSDKRNPGKFGKRRFFLVVGAPIMAIAFIFTWFFPQTLSIAAIGVAGVTALYWGAIISFNVASSAVFAPYVALLPEISEDPKNRIMVASVQGVMGLVAILAGTVTPLLFRSLIPPEQLVSRMILMAVIVCFISIGCIYITAFIIREPVQDLHTLNTDANKDTPESLREVFKSMASPLKNRDFKKYESQLFIYALAIRTPLIIIIPFVEYAMEVPRTSLMFVVLIAIPFTGVGFVIWRRLSKGSKGLEGALQIDYIMLVVALCVPITFLFSVSLFYKQFIGQLLVCAIILGVTAGVILPNPMIAAIVDKEIQQVRILQGHMSEEQRYQFSGKFYGMNSFIISLANCAAYLVSGGFLEADAQNPITLILLMSVSGLLIIPAFLILRTLSLK